MGHLLDTVTVPDGVVLGGPGDGSGSEETKEDEG